MNETTCENCGVLRRIQGIGWCSDLCKQRELGSAEMETTDGRTWRETGRRIDPTFHRVISNVEDNS